MENPTRTILIEEIDETLMCLTIVNPPANALNSAMLSRLLEILRTYAAKAEPPAIVLKGSGERFFSAGGDIREIETAGIQIAVPRMETFHRILCELESYPAPMIASVRGYAVGGALELLLYADHVVAGRNAQFGFPEINHGLMPAAKGMRRVVAMLGLPAARSLLYSGRLATADLAREIGIVDEIVDDVDGRSIAVARELRAKDQHLFAAIKRTLFRAPGLDDSELERMTLDDMKAYLERSETATARTRFLNRK